MLQFVFSGRNYVGPVKEALQFGQQRRSKSFILFLIVIFAANIGSAPPVLDLGTGGGFW
jgi:hypothetical protein